MRCLVQICVLLVLFSCFKLKAEVVPTWVTNTLEGETINTLFTYEEVLLIGGKKGAYYGVKMHLDGGDDWGYPDYDWDIQPVLSANSNPDDPAFLKNVTSMAILDDGTLYAVTDSGLFHIILDHFSHTDDVKFWYRDETFTGKNMKLKGSGDKIYILVDNRLYYKTKTTEWKNISCQINSDGFGDHERHIEEFNICGNDIIVKVPSEIEPVPQPFDLYVSTDLGESWTLGARHQQMVGDFATFRTFWNDENPDLVYNANDTWNGKSNIYFCEDIQSTDADIPVKVVHKELDGTMSSISVSSMSKSGIPLFYVATNNGVYTCGADYEFSTMKEQPDVKTPIYVAPFDRRELLTYEGSKLCYYVNWYGSTPILQESKSIEKSLFSMHMNQLVISEKVQSVQVYTALGREVYSQSSQGAGQTIHLRRFAKGHYIAKLQTENGVKTISFMR